MVELGVGGVAQVRKVEQILDASPAARAESGSAVSGCAQALRCSVLAQAASHRREAAVVMAMLLP